MFCVTFPLKYTIKGRSRYIGPPQPKISSACAIRSVLNSWFTRLCLSNFSRGKDAAMMNRQQNSQKRPGIANDAMYECNCGMQFANDIIK